jgi:hypothetical protein
MGMLAADVLQLGLPQSDKRLFVFMETDGCTSDGVAVATGAWVGRRTMRMVDYGKVAATFVDTETGRAIRIFPSPQARQLAAQAAPEAPDRWHAQLIGYQRLPDSDLLAVRRGDFEPARVRNRWPGLVPKLCRRSLLRGKHKRSFPAGAVGCKYKRVRGGSDLLFGGCLSRSTIQKAPPGCVPPVPGRRAY